MRDFYRRMAGSSRQQARLCRALAWVWVGLACLNLTLALTSDLQWVYVASAALVGACAVSMFRSADRHARAARDWDAAARVGVADG